MLNRGYFLIILEICNVVQIELYLVLNNLPKFLKFYIIFPDNAIVVVFKALLSIVYTSLNKNSMHMCAVMHLCL